jgi:general secretion pathway protein L
MGISASFIESGGLNIQISRERTPLYLNQSKLIVFCCFLTLLLLAIPVLNQEYLLIKTNNEIQKRRPLEQKALALRSYEDNVAKVQDIIARSRKTNDMLAVLGKITVALPEGTSLTQLVTNDTIVTISGESTDAAGLITRLEKVAGFYSPRFAGSITETAPDNDDIFTIEFSTTPGALIEP